MSRTGRLLELLIVVQRKPRFTVQEIASEFGVSRRTMLRDLHDLSAMGVPLAATPGPGGGYALVRSQRQLPLALTVDEAIGLVLSYEAFLRYAQSPFAPESLSVITKLRAALPPDLVQEIDRIRHHVIVMGNERTYDAPLLPDLLHAALDGAHLRVTYDSRSGVAARVIYPFGLYAANGFWYCACYDYRRAGNLSLRADRFLNVERVDGFAPPHAMSLREWLDTRERDAPNPVRLRAVISPQGMKRFDPGTEFGEMTITEQRGIINTIIPASEIDYFATRLLPLGGEIVVTSPPALIVALRRAAQDILTLYHANSASPRPQGL
ncbi:MAG: helix-turn-helix transcriptional regulator [Thermomicrobiales bacterium]